MTDNKVRKISVRGYRFKDSENQLEHSGSLQKTTLETISHQIAGAINESLSMQDNLLIRGIQSGKHIEGKGQLLTKLMLEGREYKNIENPDTIFAATYEGEKSILRILEGFHKYKPRCEERPQYPVDIWLVFQAKAYENIEYLHPRHNVLARDKWRRINPSEAGLVKIISIDNDSFHDD